MEAHKRFGRWEDNLTVALQLLIYGFAYNAPAGAPLIWFTVNAYICLITAIILSAVVTTVFQAFFWELLKVAKIEVSELVKLLCANLGKWLVPCFLFVAIAKYSPENASYSSLSFVLLSGILLAAINTFLVAAFSQREGKGALVNVCCLGMSVLLLIATISATNYELLSQAFLKAKVTCLEMAALASLESARYQDAVNLLDESLKVSPSTASTYNLRACAYQSLNKDREAIADCDKSIELKPDPNTYDTRGFSYGQLGDRESQMRDYNKAIKLDPRNPILYLYRARACEKNGDIPAAKSDREKAKLLGYMLDPFMERQLKQ